MLNQIDSYKWFPKQRSKINECLRKLDFLRKEDEFEIPISAIYEIDESSEVEISGAMDCLSKDGIIWEFKCVSEFKEEDILQLVVYACLYIKNFKNDRKYFLFNILSGETLEIKITQENAELFMKCIIGKKFETIDEDDPLETKISELHASIKEII